MEKKLLDWLMPVLLSATLAVLGWMAVNINRISENLAVAVYKIDDHEKRIDVLELYCRNRGIDVGKRP